MIWRRSSEWHWRCKLSVFSEYKKNMMNAAHNDRIRLALSRGITSYRSNVNKALEQFPHTVKLAEEVLDIKSKAIPDMQKLAEKVCEVIESNKGKAYIAF